MTDDIDPTVAHGQESRPEDREAQNYPCRENELSGHEPVPSAPPGTAPETIAAITVRAPPAGDPPNRRHAVPHRDGYKLDRPPPGWENPVIGAASPISGERRDEP